ncbi:MAG: hypothetical protein HYX25_09020 [Candidatus Solibacter usitatus]|nr:hypothetical protein [Candidatus Solibacter usitatus]
MAKLLMIGLWVLSSALGAAQVRLLFSPEDAGATNANFGKGRGVGIWSVMIKNDGLTVAKLTPEDVYMAAPAVHWYRAARAQAILLSRYANKPRNKWARLLEWGANNGEQAATGVAVAMAGSVLKASAAWQVGITSAIPIFHKVSQLLSQTEPDFGKLLDNVMIGPISLQPGDGGTYTIFSSYSPKAQSISAAIPPAAGHN